MPFINMNPGDPCITYTTLHFVASQAEKYNFSPVLTFDQPLCWKAFTIIMGENNDKIKSIVLTLGGFHTEMSF